MYALDAIQSPVSLYDPVYVEGEMLYISWIRSAIRRTGRRTGLKPYL